MTDDTTTHLLKRIDVQAEKLEQCWAKRERLVKENGWLRRENERLRQRLEKASTTPAEIWRQFVEGR